MVLGSAWKWFTVCQHIGYLSGGRKGKWGKKIKCQFYTWSDFPLFPLSTLLFPSFFHISHSSLLSLCSSFIVFPLNSSPCFKLTIWNIYGLYLLGAVYLILTLHIFQYFIEFLDNSYAKLLWIIMISLYLY